MENREFQVLCNNIRNFLNNLTTELKSININEQNINLSENHLNTITSIREKLRSYQPKLLELSDRADRICRASSTAALTMNQIFMTHSSQLDINDSVNTPVFTGYDHQNQLSINQNEINNLQTETIGSKAKRQLNEFRNEFNEINQQITEKVFDSIDRITLWKLRRYYGVPEKAVNIIWNSYDGFNCKIVHGRQLTDTFDVNTGVRQGC
ncbi:unnamed protein product [Schistosoma margrebowiei]|uniref:Uncharacterized protein n=1 Tax=Schistosoma margrebowiei TaxID=48269 RepID=A0A183LUB9_9TREM|nr:unnamed protein product [Schistosoma margrebowiei]